ncbi:MAG: GNAT family N-acetyltransferase [Polyangia bacterium]|jgi:GNAT superfamily N-acetyltransferase|nr:GNAT family N-acetyltransferase [Polyangia bacterium]
MSTLSHTRESRIFLRPAEPGDCGLIARLILELATYERQPEDCHATPDALCEMLFERRPPAAECILAEVGGDAEAGGDLVGFALFFPSFSTWECAPGIWLEDIFVRPEHRGKGAGKALFERVAELAVERGAARLEWSVLDWNQPAIDFYMAMGAQAMDGWTTHRLSGEALRAMAAAMTPGAR